MVQAAFEFEFREAQDRENYIVGVTNLEAVKWIDQYPRWKDNGLIIEGPKDSGKSHLVRVWQKKSNCNILSSEDINKELINARDKKNIAIEDVHLIENYEFLLHLINYKKEKNLNFLLTSRKSILSLNIHLNDIKSRLLEMPKVLISLPTDEIIKGLILKLLKDKGILVDYKLVLFMMNRIERSYEGVNTFIGKLNKISLEKKKKITMSIIKEALEIKYKNSE